MREVPVPFERGAKFFPRYCDKWRIVSFFQPLPWLTHATENHMADIEKEESLDLIASNKVEGTTVYNPDGEKLGSIYNFMVDKFTGQVVYAVLQFGGFLGMGSDYYPVPWQLLHYDEDKGGFVVDVDQKTLESVPHFPLDNLPEFNAAFGHRITSAYDLPRAGMGPLL
jgi:sporulation protein YlmC with PRC-barrel domain